MRTLLAAALVAMLTCAVVGAQERTASERYSNAIRKANGLTPATARLIEQTLDKGWPAPSAAETLNILLRVNSVPLAEIRRGAALPTCALYPGRNVFDRSTDDVAVLALLTRLCGVHGMRALRQGDEAQAARDVGTMLGVARHLLADRTMAVRQVGLGLVRQGCALGLRLRSKAVRPAILEAVRACEVPSVSDIALTEKEVFLDAVEFTSRQVGPLRPRMIARAPAIAATWYDPVIIAFTSGGAEERKAADERGRALGRHMRKTYGELTLSHVIERARASGMADDHVADELCRAVLCGVWLDFTALQKTLREAQGPLDELRRKAQS